MSAGAMRRRTRAQRSLLRVGMGLVVCLALTGGGVSATAAEHRVEADGGADVLGGFAVGDGLEALIDERDGGLSFTLGLGGLDLRWDSRQVGAEAGELGPGWGFGLMTIGTSGGVRVFPASGGSYEADASQASGLLGYGMRDLVFRATPSDGAPLGARADGLRSSTPYSYTVEQLGGVITYFDAEGRAMRATDGTEYAYDAANRRLSQTSGGHTTRTSYWADGERRMQTDGDSETSFYSDGATLLSEEHAGEGMASYLVGAGRHARTVFEAGAEPVSRAYDSDRHGSVVGMLDAEGRPLERAAYSDYGVPEHAPLTDTSALWRNPFGFAGEYTEPDGTQPLGNRVYDPQQLRFQTMDVAARHNLYAFGALNPVMNVDPSGRTELSDRAISWIGTGLGAAASVFTLGMAVATAGWSLTLMGVAGVAAESVALSIAVVQVVDELVPAVVEGETEQALDYAAITLGFFSFATGAIANLDAWNWATDLAIAERNYVGAVEWTGIRLRLHAAGEARIAEFRAAYDDAVVGVGSFAKVEEWQLLEEAMITVRRGLADKTPRHSLAPIEAGVSPEHLSRTGEEFLDALTSRPGTLLTPILGPRVLARTTSEITQLLGQVKLAGPRPDLVEAANELAVSAEQMRNLARVRLGDRAGGSSTMHLGDIPQDRHWLYGADPIDGGRFPEDPVDGVSLL